eukprot:CAMPEP_0172748372 /NCGR_PEP_ID=MMETSP1074-20121228/144911_1 /TAXON_ID=2916 /ORGANISM="Ceratium fusus, Strain PA161109" /LENGTH=129 /DNA_ID=CAMNT_0013580093 /DNA_START=197 /DNA_END=586 /DNA_ORIENTATION=+
MLSTAIKIAPSGSLLPSNSDSSLSVQGLSTRGSTYARAARAANTACSAASAALRRSVSTWRSRLPMNHQTRLARANTSGKEGASTPSNGSVKARSCVRRRRWCTTTEEVSAFAAIPAAGWRMPADSGSH